MSLANIQNLMLHLAIDPKLVAALHHNPELGSERFGLTPEEIHFASRLPQTVLERFQYHVAMKRLNRFSQHAYVVRTLSLFQGLQRVELIRDFLAEHEMRTNTWRQSITKFLNFVERQADHTPHGNVVRAIASFERWVYASCQNRSALVDGAGYMLAPQNRITQVPFSAEPLIRGSLSLEEWVADYGTDGYVLAQWTGEIVDLYEIDQGYYEFLLQCQQPLPWNDLLSLAEAIIARHSLEQSAKDMIQELLTMGILVHAGEEEAGWQEA